VSETEQHGVAALAAAIAEPSPAPAAGAAIGAVVALAAALVEKACALTANGTLAAEGVSAGATRAEALDFAEIDEHAFGGIAYARRMGGDVAAAWAIAAGVPLEMAESCASLAALAASIAGRVNPNLRGEVDSAVLLVRAAGLASVRLAEIDLLPAGDAYADERARLDAVRGRLA
jgi:formiminotetrahydrofolate cyclodeaminase